MADISVILPCYNVENVIDRCMESIINQTFGYKNLEIICVNDASTDGTLNRLKDWESRYDSNIMVVDCPDNMRLGTARNIGMSYASSSYVAFIDSDDWIEPDYFRKLYDIAIRGNYEVVGCLHGRDSSKALNLYNEQEKCVNENPVEYVIDSIEKRKDFFHVQPLKLYAWGKLIKKSFLLINDIVFPDHVAYEDIYWGNLVNMYVKRACLIQERLYHYFVNDNSLVLSKDAPHHVDHLTVQEMTWQEWINRGFFSEYRDELEFEYIYNGYLAFLKILVYRYTTPQYALFQLLQVTTAIKGIDCANNRYMKDGMISQAHKNIIDAISLNMTRE